MTAHIGRDEALVATDQWLRALRQFHDDGLDMLDFLTGVDRGEHIEIVARLTSSSQPSTSCFARTTVPVGGGVLPCACDIYPGAAWHERETSEMFAITIASGEHPPLLLHDQGQRGALLKARLLQRRNERPWPADAGQGSNRRTSRPLGVAPGVTNE